MEDIINFLTTIPGILIICGVVLLIIALILFIIGNKKPKVATEEQIVVGQEENLVNNEETNSNEIAVDNSNQQFTAVTPVEVTEPTENIVTDNIVTEDIPTVTPSIPVENTMEPTFSFEPQVAPVVIEEPVVEENINNVNDINNTVSSFTTPVEIPAEEHQVYGGVNPVFDFSINEEKPVSIYGGNDPLERTQSIPKVEEHHEPYGGAQDFIINEPIIESNNNYDMPIQMPEFQPNYTTPTEVNEPTTPIVEKQEPVFEIPTFEPINNNTVEQPVQEEKTSVVEEL